jgi:CBS domain-containing protein
MQAQDIMTADIATVRPDTELATAIGIMLDRRVSGLPVVDRAGALVGVLTEGDLLRRTETGTEPSRAKWLDFLMGPGRLAGEYVRTHSRLVADLMTQDVIVVTPDTPLAELVALMESKRIKRLPVVKDGALLGIVSRADLLRALARALAKPAPTTPMTDGQIHEAILAEFARQSWAPREGVTVRVDEGVVYLDGTIFDNRDRAAITVLARNVPGVKSVQDDMTWVEPVTGATLGPTI